MIKGSLLLSPHTVKRFQAILGNILMFLGINMGLTLNLSFTTPKRHIFAWFHVWAIARKNSSAGLTSLRKKI